MEIINIEKKEHTIFYQVLSNEGHIFSHEFFKGTPSEHIKKSLEILESKVDETNDKSLS